MLMEEEAWQFASLCTPRKHLLQLPREQARLVSLLVGFASPWAGTLPPLATWRCLKLEMCGVVPLLTSWQSQEAEVKFVPVGFYVIVW